jgi:hypothetical protein
MNENIQNTLLTIAIPLYYSANFLDIILENIQALPSENIEIIFSDRHHDTLFMNLLKTKLGDDKRFIFLSGNDFIDWVDHYNLLLREATGKYFMWMPHDDTFPKGYVTELLNDLKINEDIWLSFGDIRGVDTVSKQQWLLYLPSIFGNRLKKNSPFWTMCMLGFWQLDIPFRGIFRRDLIIEHQLFIKKNGNSTEFADRYWMFGLLLSGRINYNPNQYCIKRYYPDNTHYRWKEKNYFIYSTIARQTIISYIKKSGLPFLTQWQLKTLLLLISGYKKYFRIISPFVFRHSDGKIVKYRKFEKGM